MSVIAGVTAITMGLMGSLSSNAAVGVTASPNVVGGGCYTTQTLECSSYLGLGGGQQAVCNFTGVYGAPYNCTSTPCYGGDRVERHCVAGDN